MPVKLKLICDVCGKVAEGHWRNKTVADYEWPCPIGGPPGWVMYLHGLEPEDEGWYAACCRRCMNILVDEFIKDRDEREEKRKRIFWHATHLPDDHFFRKGVGHEKH